MEPTTSSGKIAREGSEPPPILSVSHLTVMQAGRLILNDVSFEVSKGTVLAIVGPNGAGKTTLLRALIGNLPHQGEVRWSEAVRIGYVPQKLVETDIPLSVEEFLAMKCPGNYGECLETVGLGRSLLKKSIGVLSGGEVQRVLIAWAIVDRPQVLLFDEPTSNVDTGSQDVIFRTLRHLQRDLHITVLLVTHDVHAVHHFADRVLVLHQRVLFRGTPEELIQSQAVLAEAFELQPGDDIHPRAETPVP